MGDIGFDKVFKNRKLSEFNKKPILKVSNTMSVLSEDFVNIDYVVIKIGNKTFSTKKGDFQQGKLQFVKTKDLGHEDNLWVKGSFTHGKKHEELPENIPFEMNIYAKTIVEDD